MSLDAWLPLGLALPGGQEARAILFDAPDWQIYETSAGGRALVAKEALGSEWLRMGLLTKQQVEAFKFGGEALQAITSPPERALWPVSKGVAPRNKKQALAFVDALLATRRIDATSPLQDAIYVEAAARFLPTQALSAAVSDDIVLGTWLTGGVPVSARSFRRLQSLVGWMGRQHLEDVVSRAGYPPVATAGASGAKKGGGKPRFQLAGRPQLEAFLNDHVIDIVENQERYKKLGIDFPSAIILHGPPGCGKTFAIERLVEYLGWPSYSIDASSVASPYIHETSKKVAGVFEQAMQNAPSVIVIDEMEAFLADRQGRVSSGHHNIEEVSEFLRRIPEAIKNHVLIVAMTNVIDMIDPAIRRRGRFDHVIKVDMASEEEVRGLLEKLVSEVPRANDVDVSALAAQLTGRPLSDVAFVVREAARLAARAGRHQLDQASLLAAAKATQSRTDEPRPARKIGFT